MQEIEKMEGVDLLRIHIDYENGESKNCKGDFSEAIKQELLKRLKKPEVWSYTSITPAQAVEEFRNKLVSEIIKLQTLAMHTNGDWSQDECVSRKLVIDLINNIE